MSASNIPMGSEYDKNAIWEQVENQAVERDCEVTETITRRVTLSTADYISEEDLDDEFGKCVSADTSDTDWVGEYSNQEYTVLELIDKLKAYVEEDFKDTSPNTSKGRELQRLLSACNGWEQVELNVEEE